MIYLVDAAPVYKREVGVLVLMIYSCDNHLISN